MKMIRIVDKSESYLVDTEKKVRAFGITFFRRKSTFQMVKKNKRWFNTTSNRKATKKESAKLDFWINMHRKFVASQLESG